MGVRRNIARWAQFIRNPGPRCLENQLQRQIDLPAQGRVARIEGINIDIFWRERQHRAGVPVLGRQDAEMAAKHIGPTEQHLGHRIAAHRTRRLENNSTVHVMRERQKAIAAIRRAVVSGVLCEADQHGGPASVSDKSASSPVSSSPPSASGAPGIRASACCSIARNASRIRPASSTLARSSAACAIRSS